MTTLLVAVTATTATVAWLLTRQWRDRRRETREWERFQEAMRR